MLLQYKHQTEFQEIENIIKRKTSGGYLFLEFLLIIWLLGQTFVIGIILWGLFQILGDGYTSLMQIGILIGIGIIPAIGYLFGLAWIPVKMLAFFIEMRKAFRRIGILLTYYRNYDTGVEKLQNIPNLLEYILSFLKKNKIYGFFLSTKDVSNLVNWLYLILTDLRSDLQIRLAEQQQTLEQGISEVKQNIKGTSELNQISELQRARLDRQIEQFEELQRVFMKV